MIAIIDYGVGNLFSLSSSLKAVGADCAVTSSPEVIRQAEKLILPGVGAFGDAAEKLKKNGLDRLIKQEAENGKPLLGICLGMQLLFQKSYEFGEYEGLGLIEGEVVPMQGRLPGRLPIPHIGWNALELVGHPSLFRHIQNGDHVYFVHSFFADHCEKNLIAATEYGVRMTAAAARGSIVGCQFHPEKSGETGLAILRAFCETEETA